MNYMGVVMVSFSLISCASSTREQVKVDIIGEWSVCKHVMAKDAQGKDTEKSEKYALTYSSGNEILTKTGYRRTGCAEADREGALVITSGYSLGKTASPSNGATELDTEVIKVSIIPYTSEVLSAYASSNDLKYTLNGETDVSSKVNFIGKKTYNIYLVRGSRLYFGDLGKGYDASAPALRPVSVDFHLSYSKVH